MSQEEVKDRFNHWSLIILIVALFVLVFFIGRMTNKPVEKTQLPDNSKYERKIDSLEGLNAKYSDSLKWSHKTIDSLKNLRVINNKKVKDGIRQIKNFTVNSRQRFHDSVMAANGFK